MGSKNEERGRCHLLSDQLSAVPFFSCELAGHGDRVPFSRTVAVHSTNTFFPPSNIFI